MRWIASADNPFGIDVLDCSAFAETMVAMTSSAEVAARFGQLRGSNGEHCRGAEPAIDLTTKCDLRYPSDRHADGALFKAEEMEDKWDVYLFDGSLYFTRSWTGDLAYKASVVFDNGTAVVTEVQGLREPGCGEDPPAVVDFLIKSHIFGLVAPHPLPNDAGADVDQLALWSFARYGRRGLFGTTSDARHLTVVRDANGRCQLELQGR